MPKLQVLHHGTDIFRRDATFEPLDTVDGNHWNAIAIAFKYGWVAPDINLIEGELVISREVLQMRASVVTQVTTGLRIEHNGGFHVRFFPAAYGTDSGTAHSRG